MAAGIDNDLSDCIIGISGEVGSCGNYVDHG